MTGRDTRGHGRVAIVTDSTAYLPAAVAEQYDVSVVPLHVTVGDRTGVEGVDIAPGEVAAALAQHVRVTTSRPTPADFAKAYRAALDAGASAVLSVQLSAALSGTWESARLGAQECGGDPVVRVLDSRTTAMGLGYAVLAAARVAADGGSLDDAYDAAQRTVERTSLLFYVDSLEFLRRGGRIGAAAALLGTALSVKPILHVVDGNIVLRERVRTASRGVARLEALAVEAAGDGVVDLAVHHLAAADHADALSDRLRAALPGTGMLLTAELGAAVGAHTGPGTLGVVVVRR